MRAGVDTGGTFTDVVGDDGRVLKVLSMPDDPSAAVRAALDALGPVEALVHGTTVATNALLERRGATVALVTNKGFADVIEIARQDRPSLYDPFADRPEPLVARGARLTVSGRLDGSGRELEPVGPAPGPTEVGAAEAVAVCLLHADLNPVHEQAVAAELRAAGHDVTASHEVAPEFREYERTVTTVANAYLRPMCRRYLAGLTGLPRLPGSVATVQVLTSAGGLWPVERGMDTPVGLLLSGPAAGVGAAATAAVAAGFPDAVTLDMGGTSTDVCLVLNGQPAPAAQRTVAGFPIRLPALDIHTIGAGGGSIAYIDPGGALRVGPRSAGADPGPACYGRGGRQPTVTDADLLAGHLPAGLTLPGIGALDEAAAAAALAPLEQAGATAQGVIAVVDAAMVEAVRAVTVQRGVDPRRLALVAFGGAGPVHACALADALSMPAVVVPPRAGVLSAEGLLRSPLQADLVRSWPRPREHRGLDTALAALAAEAREAVLGGCPTTDGVVPRIETSVDCRYDGQGHELTVAHLDDFENEHERRNGYRRAGTPVEVIALRARATIAAPEFAAPPTVRVAHTGPVAVAEPDCTLWLPAGWVATVHDSGAWVVRRV